ncbi:MAG: hypothetical protein K0R21_913 [Anaerocolumna sp.]|jgi:hypothetical protein|nr:hypothetical protein [Anaerocolumna sp.]
MQIKGIGELLERIRSLKEDGLFRKVITFQLIIMYLEIAFHLMIFKSISSNLLIPILFALPWGMLLALVTSMFTPKINTIVIWGTTIVLCLVYITQLVYYHVFKAFLSFYSIAAVGTDVLEFFEQIVFAIVSSFIGILVLLLPVLFIGYFIKWLGNKEESISRKALAGTLCLFFHLVSILVLPAFGKNAYSPYDLYHYTWIQEMSMEQLGVLTTGRKDILRLVAHDSNALQASVSNSLVGEGQDKSGTKTSGNQSKDNSSTKGNNSVKENSSTTDDTSSQVAVIIPEITPKQIDTSPNVLNIDFLALAEQETDEEIKALHEYFGSAAPTNKNEYTGMFQGYNLIMITAEGFSPYAVDKEITPTLYKLTQEGFVFRNFYTPLWWASTSDGEYVACTGLIPKSGVTSFYLSGSNAMPFALGNQFRKIDYVTNAYHNHTYTYYKRHISHPNMGYEYKGVGNGLQITKSWPESDLEMIEVTVPEYINNQPFHTYYMTVSGHMNYTFMGNSMATKNKEAVNHLSYSMEAKAYLACNVELDRALEKLIEELEAKGIADKTVIALSADHYPYGLEKDKIDELAGHEVEENFELYRNHFILWTPSIKEPITVDKVCSSLDIMPTLSNLFGLPYDSRVLIGKDILSDANPLVIFSNRSFISDKVKYNSRTKEVTLLTDEKLPDDYINTMNQMIRDKFIVSESILDENYYSYLLSELD